MFDLKKFGESTALITESEKISYNELAELSQKIGDVIKRRCLIFLLATNSVDSIACYLGFLNNKIVPLMVDADLNFELAKNLVEIGIVAEATLRTDIF